MPQNLCKCKLAQASFNFENQPARYCSKCKLDKMINVRSNQKKCFCGKTNQPHYGRLNQTATHCYSCKTNDMINVHKQRCQCGKRQNPSFGVKNQKATCCLECKLPEMINLQVRKYTVQKKQQFFENVNIGQLILDLENQQNNQGQTLFCNKCKQFLLLNNFSYRKIEQRYQQPCKSCKGIKCHCGTYATFGYEKKKPLYCSKHKKSDMENVMDLKCIKCNIKYPCYGYEKWKATHCAGCKQSDMVNVVSKRCQCGSIPSYGYEKGKAKYCAKCKPEDALDVSHHNVCKSDWCNTLISNPKYNGYCTRCFVYLFPDNKIKTNLRIKEQFVADFIQEKFQNHQITYNKKIQGGCSPRRPDIFIELYTHSIIVECNEYAHKDYSTSCEEQRINDIFTDLGDRPVVFINFNPDSYEQNGVKYYSCFKTNKVSGIQMVSNKKEWNQRLLTLQNCIQKNIDNIPQQNVKLEFLYYDC